MTTTIDPTETHTPVESSAPQRTHRLARALAVLVLLGGIALTLGGAASWVLVQTNLADERITVSEDARWFAGRTVQDPLTAYAQADVIKKHAAEISGGRTYAEMDQDDPARDAVQTTAFLRASLFTSVLSFGVAALATGLGVIAVAGGTSLLRVTARPRG